MKRILIYIIFLSVSSVSVSAAGITQKYEALTNPLPPEEFVCLSAVCDLKEFFLLIIRDIIQIIPIVAVIVIIVAGFQMILSGGNEEKIAKAKRMLLWAILGLVIAFMSFSIVAITQNLIGVQP